MRDMFKDDATGQVSLGRVSAALILVYLLACTGHLMIVKGTLVDIPVNWLTAMVTFYGINKASSTVKEVKGNVGTATDTQTAGA